MVYVRRKKITYKDGKVKGTDYFYIVDSKKDKDGKIKQKVLAYIGDKEKLRKFHESLKKHLS